ncbi:hypothetical protein FMUND_15122 [Fusarium mundagurra]|uniref:Uncharacterized protein n=1 Tax=Fusarium mundagurra TaxID=1567541 RepID=A0A8H6CZR1_9HYPO|nr:hypothetical protein FMUND_15122 [Fusarium mundagurra]
MAESFSELVEKSVVAAVGRISTLVSGAGTALSLSEWHLKPVLPTVEYLIPGLQALQRDLDVVNADYHPAGHFTVPLTGFKELDKAIKLHHIINVVESEPARSLYDPPASSYLDLIFRGIKDWSRQKTIEIFEKDCKDVAKMGLDSLREFYDMPRSGLGGSISVAGTYSVSQTTVTKPSAPDTPPAGQSLVQVHARPSIPSPLQRHPSHRLGHMPPTDPAGHYRYSPHWLSEFRDQIPNPHAPAAARYILRTREVWQRHLAAFTEFTSTAEDLNSIAQTLLLARGSYMAPQIIPPLEHLGSLLNDTVTFMFYKFRGFFDPEYKGNTVEYLHGLEAPGNRFISVDYCNLIERFIEKWVRVVEAIIWIIDMDRITYYEIGDFGKKGYITDEPEIPHSILDKVLYYIAPPSHYSPFEILLKNLELWLQDLVHDAIKILNEVERLIIHLDGFRKGTLANRPQEHPEFHDSISYLEKQKSELLLHQGVLLTYRMQLSFEAAHSTAKMVSRKLYNVRSMVEAIRESNREDEASLYQIPTVEKLGVPAQAAATVMGHLKDGLETQWRIGWLIRCVKYLIIVSIRKRAQQMENNEAGERKKKQANTEKLEEKLKEIEALKKIKEGEEYFDDEDEEGDFDMDIQA